MSVLNPTPTERLVDTHGRPCFLWDLDLSVDQFRELLKTGDRVKRAYLIGKLMRQAKPDDVFSFVSLQEIRALRTDIQPFLGRTRAFWNWLLTVWKDDRVA